ncbi:MAG: glycosyltransferase family 2 protein [Bacteroidales bacterium]|nr:glycosyltransferase family 2 protein [Bacteroidales bacterium]
MKLAILITCYNRKAKTLGCLDSIQGTLRAWGDRIRAKVFLTDDGCTDGTAEAVRGQAYDFTVEILKGTGQLFWNGGMINSWRAALREGGFDGYLWINDDIKVLPDFWGDLLAADSHCLETYGKHGIYVGSTMDAASGKFTYGGFRYVSKFTLVDEFVKPDGEHFQECEAAHGNITYVSSEVVERMGVLCDRYEHAGSDHDYIYRAYKAGFPVLVLPHFSASCENDHIGKTRDHAVLPLRQRMKLFFSPQGYNMHNTLLFNWRCFPWRVPFVFVSGLVKMLFPRLGYNAYLLLRGAKRTAENSVGPVNRRQK